MTPFAGKGLIARRFADVEHSFSTRDTMLYALGLGCGADPMAEDELRFVYDEGLAALPTMAVVLGLPGFWLQDADTGADWKRALHGEQGMVLHAPVPTHGTVVGRTRVVDVIDKGTAKGAFMYSTREIHDKQSGQLIATLTQTTVLRGNGGFSEGAQQSSRIAPPPPHVLPTRAPDTAVDIDTLPQAALIYRLLGDYNPLHADPKVARAAGYPRPILHGLCTFGVAGRALLKACCGNDPGRLRSMAVRFSAPVFPGERIRTEIWRDGPIASFRCRIPARDTTVLECGKAEIAG